MGGVTLHARVTRRVPARETPPLVLVHGLGVSSRYFVPLAELLAPHHRVLALDLPGFGLSDRPRTVLDVPGLADALVGWITARGLGTPVLVGNSLGCQVVARAVARDPALAAALVLIGPTIDRDARSALRQIGRLLLDIPREAPGLAFIVAADYVRAGPRRLLGTLAHALEDRLEEAAASVQAPLLVVTGARDPIAPRRWAEEVARRAPHGEVRVIPGAAHAAHYGAPREVVRVLLPFLRDALADRGG